MIGWIWWNIRFAFDVQLHLLEKSDLRPDGDEAVHFQFKIKVGKYVVDDFTAKTVGNDNQFVIVALLACGSLMQSVPNDFDDFSGTVFGAAPRQIGEGIPGKTRYGCIELFSRQTFGDGTTNVR